MKKHKVIYRFNRYDGEVLLAKIEIPFEMKLQATLILDQLCYSWNKKQLQKQLDDALARGDEKQFEELSKAYRNYIWE